MKVEFEKFYQRPERDDLYALGVPLSGHNEAKDPAQPEVEE